MEHRRAILNDPAGTEAKAWVEGRRGRGIGKRVTAQTSHDLYFNLSMDSHGDPRPISRLHDPETNTITLEPRRTAATRASLLLHAGFARDQAVAIATLCEMPLGGVDELDAAIKAGWQRMDDGQRGA